MGNISSSNPKYTSASNSPNNSTNENDSTNDGPSDSSNESSSDSTTSSSSRDIILYNEIKNKLKDEELCKSLEERELNELILNLGDETRFLNQYLQLGDNHLNQITNDLRTLVQNNNFSIISLGEYYVRNLLRKHRRKSDKFNIYLFISKLRDDRSDSPFLRFFAKSLLRNKYGMFHVGLEIDGIILEWGTGDAGPHLIYPRVNTKRLCEKLAHIRVNYGQEFNLITTFSETWYHKLYNYILNKMRKFLSFVPKIGSISSDKLQIIARKCVYWNKNFNYNPLRRNCQHFIEEILEALGLTFNPEGEFKKFLDRIVNYADDSFLFQEEEFLSRQDLDQFADKNWDKISNVWDKRLLLCYSDMMNNMYEYKHDKKWEKWGPMNSKEKWVERENELRTD
ncbi:uncharacterized protein OCT59_025544 [Rhizophagus irregularis]|uniref:PPPDE domain-containing protein n=2 Tax=Rhizophagus irregularis TaxID=588596 RepID=A0A015J9P6_RHIIW|nr:hypothetical protein GLOIN_2v1478103 [Rhizophagus irregularis DAOM 181602=DAOM 197198]EXX63595.1 hypothetical protein RirG_150920 [Rhizophagus irregularis DAOM 197198w]POG71990.1 hypothetical protein GLOIN_2v1478103 [Rhizophagus irregularis DAOM 181602=DAOM 197198]UZO05184.1 hypothetical protein OCT59_025544 [Rhizophagus irregularis]|eukprot:XP_025178856.1 hypothetical protein GLOIN_2v1478103 [Rhizophagus irregularis DAOM 181602=DAOM 197198]